MKYGKHNKKTTTEQDRTKLRKLDFDANTAMHAQVMPTPAPRQATLRFVPQQ